MINFHVAALLALGSASDLVIPRSHLGFVVLQPSDCLNGFSATLQEFGNNVSIGGDNVVADAAHHVPLKFTARGDISFDQCSQIAARSRDDVIGFVWGVLNSTVKAHALQQSSDFDGLELADFSPFIFKDVHPPNRSLQSWSDMFATIPPEHYACSILLGSVPLGNVTSLDCGTAADLCAQHRFTNTPPAGQLPPALESVVANAVCCQQISTELAVKARVPQFFRHFLQWTDGISNDAILTVDLWLAYTRESNYTEHCDHEDPTWQGWQGWLIRTITNFVVLCFACSLFSPKMCKRTYVHPQAMYYWASMFFVTYRISLDVLPEITETAAHRLVMYHRKTLGWKVGVVFFQTHVRYTIPLLCVQKVFEKWARCCANCWDEGTGTGYSYKNAQQFWVLIILLFADVAAPSIWALNTDDLVASVNAHLQFRVAIFTFAATLFSAIPLCLAGFWVCGVQWKPSKLYHEATGTSDYMPIFAELNAILIFEEVVSPQETPLLSLVASEI